jgi:hypothetical protein
VSIPPPNAANFIHHAAPQWLFVSSERRDRGDVRPLHGAYLPKCGESGRKAISVPISDVRKFERREKLRFGAINAFKQTRSLGRKNLFQKADHRASASDRGTAFAR